MVSCDEHNLHKLIEIYACCIEAQLLLFAVVMYQASGNLPVITEFVFLNSCVFLTLQQWHWYL